MKKITQITIAIFTLVLIASCGGSKKEHSVVINELKVKLEKEKKEKADNEAAIKKLEAELLRLDTNAANAARIKLVTVRPVVSQNFEHFIDLMGRVDAENISYISPRGMPGQVKAVFVKTRVRRNTGMIRMGTFRFIIRFYV